MTNEKKLLFSVTANDCDWSYARGTGNGGQARNKSNNAVHCTHRASGAHGYSESSRSQHENKRDAFEKMANSEQFKLWHQLEVSRRTGVEAEIKRTVERELKKVKTEIRVDDKWREVGPSDLVDDPNTFDVTKLKD